MKTTPVIKPLLMASASAVLGLAIVGVLGDAPAQAAQFRVYGKFAPEPAINLKNTVDFIENGSFEGTLDIDETYVDRPLIKGWEVQLLDSQGSSMYFFSSRSGSYSDSYFSSNNYVSKEITGDRSWISIVSSFSNGRRPNVFSQKAALNLFLDQPDFTGKILPDSNTDFLTVYDNPTFPLYYYKLNVVDGYIEKVVTPPVTSVPEPLTIGGTVVAGAMGWWIKRRKKALQEV